MKLQHRTGFLTAVAVILVLFLTSTGMCGKKGYNYISVQEIKARMDAGDHENGSMVIMTSQTEKEYQTGYIKAAYPTFARPLKTDIDFAKLIPFFKRVKDTSEAIVFICPRGKSGAGMDSDDNPVFECSSVCWVLADSVWQVSLRYSCMLNWFLVNTG
jgi:thiosulfate/3-mercaptopyruvate sulfurtransferase